MSPSASCCKTCNRVAASATLARWYTTPCKPRRVPRPTAPGTARSERRADRRGAGPGRGRGWISAAELAVALGVDRSTGWRLARSLGAGRAGCTTTRSSHRYRLGMPLFELGTRVLDTIDVRDEARRVMTELVASTGESVDLAIRDGDSVVFIDKIDGTAEVRAFTRSGQRARLHATAAGKVFLAAMPTAELRAYLAGPLAALHAGDDHGPGDSRGSSRRPAGGAGRSTAASSSWRRAPSPSRSSMRAVAASRRSG